MPVGGRVCVGGEKGKLKVECAGWKVGAGGRIVQFVASSSIAHLFTPVDVQMHTHIFVKHRRCKLLVRWPSGMATD